MQWFPAPGKLNLMLHVLGRRAAGPTAGPTAGMHELQTVFRLVDRCDRVGIRLRSDGEIRFTGDYGEDNLCMRAARRLKTAAGTVPGADIELEKNLPVGGGMGGGSSDAATVLMALNRLWNLGQGSDELMRIGAELGADVPVFVFGRNAFGEGVGERLKALDLGPAWYLVLAPQVSVSTKEIFSDPALTRDTKPLKIPPFLSGQGRNDLQASAVRRYPEIAESLAWLKEHGLAATIPARMTGSGACVFAEFARQDEAESLYRELPAGMRGFVARGLERHPMHEQV